MRAERRGSTLGADALVGDDIIGGVSAVAVGKGAVLPDGGAVPVVDCTEIGGISLICLRFLRYNPDLVSM